MTKIQHRDAFSPDCPIRNILSRIGDKWSILTLYTLSQRGTMRFNEFQKEMADISQKMLTATLRTLEEDGFVDRKIYPQVPPRVEYKLTERGSALLVHVDTLVRWAKDNMEGILNDRNQHRIERLEA